MYPSTWILGTRNAHDRQIIVDTKVRNNPVLTTTNVNVDIIYWSNLHNRVNFQNENNRKLEVPETLSSEPPEINKVDQQTGSKRKSTTTNY